MIKVTGPFPSSLFRIAPYTLFVSGIVIGANGGPKDFLLGAAPLWIAVTFAVVSFWFCRGAINGYVKEAE